MYSLILRQEKLTGTLIGSNVIYFENGIEIPNYTTGINPRDGFECKEEWKLKEYTEEEKVNLFDAYRPGANVSYMDKVEGFVRIYKNPNDGVLIIKNGLGLSSSIQSFAILLSN
jgi:hypothetical protein